MVTFLKLPTQNIIYGLDMGGRGLTLFRILEGYGQYMDKTTPRLRQAIDKT